MFKTLLMTARLLSVKNLYYNIVDKRLVCRHRPKTDCNGALKSNEDCSRMGCKSVECVDKPFICVITNSPPRAGGVDCKCEVMCMAKKSETANITENKKNI
jgi:hypothetical protein